MGGREGEPLPRRFPPAPQRHWRPLASLGHGSKEKTSAINFYAPFIFASNKGGVSTVNKLGFRRRPVGTSDEERTGRK